MLLDCATRLKKACCIKCTFTGLFSKLRCCKERGVEEVRHREGGGNCHIKVKEFKINLISQSLSGPKSFAVSKHRLVINRSRRKSRRADVQEQDLCGSNRGR